MGLIKMHCAWGHNNIHSVVVAHLAIVVVVVVVDNSPVERHSWGCAGAAWCPFWGSECVGYCLWGKVSLLIVLWFVLLWQEIMMMSWGLR